MRGRSGCRRSSSALLSHGRPADDTAALVYAGTLPTQETVTGTLEEIATEDDAVRRPSSGGARRRPRGGAARTPALVRRQAALRQAGARHAAARRGGRARRAARGDGRRSHRSADDPDPAAGGLRAAGRRVPQRGDVRRHRLRQRPRRGCVHSAAARRPARPAGAEGREAVRRRIGDGRTAACATASRST